MTKKNTPALMTLISVFFFWGFIAASNDILIPVFKEELSLSQSQSQMVSLAFYVAYAVGSILYLIISSFMKRDILGKIGYKNGISLGLAISAVGAFMFVPAANYASFPLMLSGLFVVGLGFSLQQTAANPLVISIGDPKKGNQRLSLAGGINNIGTTIGPVILGFALFGTAADKSNFTMDNLIVPYVSVGIAFLLVAVIIKYSSIPNYLSDTDSEPNYEDADDILDSSKGLNEEVTATPTKSVFSYPQLWMGMIAIFVYVGVEVSTASNLGEYLKQGLGLEPNEITPYISLYWASLMIGRWTSAAGVFSEKKKTQRIFSLILPYLAFGIFILANSLNTEDMSPFLYYMGFVAIIIVADFFSKGNPVNQLGLYSILGIIALLVGIYTDGMVSVYAIISVGLFCSTLWPCIFTLAIAGLGKLTSKGSGYLIMMIMGGGFISYFQGLLADVPSIGIKLSFWMGVLCFAFLAFYAYSAKKTLKKQGIDYES